MIRIEILDGASDAASVEVARTLLLEYGRFVLESEGPSRFCFGKLEEEAAGLPGFFTSHGGKLLLAWVDDKAAGCVTYRALPAIEGACEMKRLWVRPEFRGLGLGETLTQKILERAARAGFTSVYLDTVPASMGPAYRSYLRLGFEECPPYHGSPMEGLFFMRRNLP